MHHAWAEEQKGHAELQVACGMASRRATGSQLGRCGRPRYPSVWWIQGSWMKQFERRYITPTHPPELRQS